ncbi:hypothetical protein D3C85_1515170 [compost metagenome]
MLRRITRSHDTAQRMAAQHKRQLRMHADNLSGRIAFNQREVQRHFGDIERVSGSGDFFGQRSISLRRNQRPRVKNYGRSKSDRRLK